MLFFINKGLLFVSMRNIFHSHIPLLHIGTPFVYTYTTCEHYLFYNVQKITEKILFSLCVPQYKDTFVFFSNTIKVYCFGRRVLYVRCALFEIGKEKIRETLTQYALNLSRRLRGRTVKDKNSTRKRTQPNYLYPYYHLD